MSEAEVQDMIRIEAMKEDCQLWRNNTGVLYDASGRPVRYGLANDSKKQNEVLKSSDLIGIKTITITPEMVGQRIGVFSSIEVKDPKWNPQKKLDLREQAQRNWIELVKSRGGIAGFANSVESGVKLLRR